VEKDIPVREIKEGKIYNKGNNYWNKGVVEFAGKGK
jgi:hypothetical protein